MHKVKNNEVREESSVFQSNFEALIARQLRREIARRRFGRMGES